MQIIGYLNKYCKVSKLYFIIQLEIAGRTDIPVAEGSHVTITVCIVI